MTKIQFELDGKQVEANAGETIWQVAKRQGREIPHLCYSPEPDYRPDGNCRACMVEIEGERVLAASCKRTPSVGMKVKTASARAIAAQKMVMELLVADQPARADLARSGLEILALGREGRGDRKPLSGRRALAGRRQPSGDARSISMPASSAACACAPAARCRSTTSSAWPIAATAPRSCSTSTIRWANRPASPAANACRPARPAR